MGKRSYLSKKISWPFTTCLLQAKGGYKCVCAHAHDLPTCAHVYVYVCVRQVSITCTVNRFYFVQKIFVQKIFV